MFRIIPGKRVVIIKKLFALSLSLMVIFTAFTACSKAQKAETDSQSETNATSPTIATQEAKIKDSDAIRFIEQSYTKEELGLDKTDKDYSFMISTYGTEIDGEKYVRVFANVVTKNDETNKDGKDTFSMETVGEYGISFDGKKVVKKDMETGEYTELENRYADYSAKGQTVSEHNHTEDETTKK